MKIESNKNIAFTLVELLVVIAIIGILSGLIIVGMNSSTNSARIAKAQIYSASLRDSLLMNIVSEWKFDNISGTVNSALTDGTTIADNWKSNNGTTSGGPTLRNGTNCVYDQCLQFDGSNDYVSIPYSSTLDFGTGNFSISAWVKGGNQGSGEHIIIRKDDESSSPRRFWSFLSLTNTVLFEIYDSAQGSPFKQTGTTVIGDNNWHLLIGTRNGDNIYLYLDGNLASGPTSGCSPWIMTNTGGSLSIGKYQVANGAYYTGSIDEVRLYNSAIPTSKIKEYYYAGLNKILAKGEIDKIDYETRIK